MHAQAEEQQAQQKQRLEEHALQELAAAAPRQHVGEPAARAEAEASALQKRGEELAQEWERRTAARTLSEQAQAGADVQHDSTEMDASEDVGAAPPSPAELWRTLEVPGPTGRQSG